MQEILFVRLHQHLLEDVRIGLYLLMAYGPFPLSTHSERVAGNIRKQMSGRHPFFYSTMFDQLIKVGK